MENVLALNSWSFWSPEVNTICEKKGSLVWTAYLNKQIYTHHHISSQKGSLQMMGYLDSCTPKETILQIMYVHIQNYIHIFTIRMDDLCTVTCKKRILSTVAKGENNSLITQLKTPQKKKHCPRFLWENDSTGGTTSPVPGTFVELAISHTHLRLQSMEIFSYSKKQCCYIKRLMFKVRFHGISKSFPTLLLNRCIIGGDVERRGKR